MWLSMRPTPSMLNWSCPPPNLCKSYQGSEPFPSGLYLDLRLNLFFCLNQKSNFYLLCWLGFFFCSNCFTKVILCAFAKGWWFQKSFFQISQIWSLPRFSGPGCFVSCPKSLRGLVGDWALAEQWWMRARSETPNQPTNPTQRQQTNQTNPAHWCCSSSMVMDKQQHIWRATE